MEFYLLFLENVGDNYRPTLTDQLDVMIAPQAPGWVVLEAPEINLIENRTMTNKGTVFSLSHTLRLTNDTRIEKKGIHVYSSVNISVYAYDAKFHTREAYYVLPTESLSTEYIAMSYRPLKWKSLIGILATRDHTVVNVTLNTTGIVHYHGATLGNGAMFTLDLDKLHTYQVTSHSDLTGTKIKSNYPVVVVSGDQCALDTNYDYCQPLYEEMIPPSKWGKQFLIPPLNMISSLYTIRIASQQNHTQVIIQGIHMREQHYFINSTYFLAVNMSQNDTISVSADASVFVYIITTSSHWAGFATTIPALSHYSSKYDFQVPSGHGRSGYVAYISITCKSVSVNQALLDGKRLNFNSNNTRTILIGIDNYSEVTMSIQPGKHRLVHTTGEGMGLLVYGTSYQGGYPLAYGYPGGLMLN